MCSPEGGGSALSGMLAKEQASALVSSEQLESPSPTTVLKTGNNSGTYMCSSVHLVVDNVSTVVIYHGKNSTTPTTTSSYTQISQSNNMMDTKNSNNENENYENQYQYENRYKNFSENQHFKHPVRTESQQEADEKCIERGMNSLGNERQDD